MQNQIFAKNFKTSVIFGISLRFFINYWSSL